MFQSVTSKCPLVATNLFLITVLGDENTTRNESIGSYDFPHLTSE